MLQSVINKILSNQWVDNFARLLRLAYWDVGTSENNTQWRNDAQFHFCCTDSSLILKQIFSSKFDQLRVNLQITQARNEAPKPFKVSGREGKKRWLVSKSEKDLLAMYREANCYLLHYHIFPQNFKISRSPLHFDYPISYPQQVNSKNQKTRNDYKKRYDWMCNTQQCHQESYRQLYYFKKILGEEGSII